MNLQRSRHAPSAADYRDTSPEDGRAIAYAISVVSAGARSAERRDLFFSDKQPIAENKVSPRSPRALVETTESYMR
jgi:hypothetical protein